MMAHNRLHDLSVKRSSESLGDVWPHYEGFAIELPGVAAQPMPQTDSEWKVIFQSLMKMLERSRAEAIGGELSAIRAELALLRQRVSRVEGAAPSMALIQTLAPSPYEILKPIQVLVRADGEEYTASFVDANIASGGATMEEAVENLKDLLTSMLDMLDEHTQEQLGIGPTRQLAILREFIQRR